MLNLKGIIWSGGTKPSPREPDSHFPGFFITFCIKYFDRVY